MRILSAGPKAILIELDDLNSVLGLYAEIEKRRNDGWQPSLIDVVPGARTILLNGLGDPRKVSDELRTWPHFDSPPPKGDLVELETIYDGEDIDEVAKIWGMTAKEVIQVHTNATFYSAFCGFSPGFAYLIGLPKGLTVPRRTNPRPAVPAGSVALADEFSSVYPRRSPGGWQLIGRTSASLWDLERDPPTLLAPGTRIRFVEIEG